MYERTATGWAKHLDFIILDMMSLEISFILAYIIRHGFFNPYENVIYRNMGIVILFMDFVMLLFLDTLRDVLKRGYYKEFIYTLRHVILFMLVLTAYMFATQDGEAYSRITIFVMTVVYFAITYCARTARKRYIIKHAGKRAEKSLLIISNTEIVDNIIKSVEENNYGCYVIKGLVFRENGQSNERKIPVVATYENTIEYVKNNWVDEVLVALSPEEELPTDLIDQLTIMGVTVHVNLEKSSRISGVKQVVGTVGNLVVISSSLNDMSARQKTEKRLLDIIGGIIGCMITIFLYIVLAPLIKKESHGPVFFTQIRIGKNGKPFKLYKFRSMYMDAEERKAELMKQNRIENGLMFKIEFDPRVIGNHVDENGNRKTGIGEFIRRYSIDEFPQFFNVLKGDMSLVGTRPPTQDEVNQYEARHRARLAIKPGITGMWQVNGRSNITDFEEVVKLDMQYINNWDIGLDIKILLKTIKVILNNEGAM